MTNDRGMELSQGELFADRYVIGTKLGEGSFGQVYQAKLQSTGQQVAIKLLRLRDAPGFPPLDKQLSRFEREINLSARLHHPHIVRLIDSGVAADGLTYSVFDYVPGQTLAQWIREQGRLSQGTTERIMGQVLDALACAHGIGIIHRDLKPGNIMILRTGIQPHALVLDFGLAGMVNGRAADQQLARLTGTRESLGTPAYAAPEQLRGEPASPSSDLYSWGLIFLECITGKRVMSGKGLPDILFKQLGPEPVQIPASLRNQPLGLQLRRVLEKNPQERTASIAELLSTLDVSRHEIGPVSGIPEAASEVGTSSSPTSGSWHSDHGELRQVTAVSLRMSISAGLADELGFEAVDELVRSRQELVAELAERFDGFLSGTLSDRQMVFFGYPRAAENDVRRAAGFALSLPQHFARLAQADNIGLHIGMHTGMVVAGDISRNPGLGSLTGATPLIATQLEASAQAGEILTTQETRVLVERWYNFEPADLPAPSAAGKRGTFRLTGKRELKGDAQVSYTAAKIVGRDHELELLAERWRMAAAGSGQLIVVTAEPGIGKSRLVAEFVQHVGAEAGDNCLEARCAPEDTNSAARPLIGMLERMLDVTPQSDRAGRLDRIEAALQAKGIELADNVPLLALLLGVDLAGRYPHPQIEPKALKARTLNLLATLLVSAAADQPTLLVVEDLHWADATTIEFLSAFVEKLAESAICAVFTARPEFEPPWEPSQFLQIQLGRLPDEAARLLVSEIAGGKTLPEEVIEMTVKRTDGVALFVEELVRNLLESDLLQLEGDTYRLVGSLANFDIPSTLRASLMARLDRLGDAKSTAQLAAALGREFDLELLRHVSTMTRTSFDQAIETLRDAGLLQKRRRFGQGTYLFKHALVRDISYDSIPQRTRPLIHARIAEAIVADFPVLVDQRPEMLAHHYGEAGNYAQALLYTRLAAKALFSRSAAFEAIEQANKGFAWLANIEDEVERAKEELALIGVLNPAVMMTKGWISEEAKKNIDRSQQLLRQVGDDVAAIGAMWAQLNYNHMTGQRHEARKFARGLVERAEQSSDTDALVASLPQLGHCLWIDGNYREARAPLERAIELYDHEAHSHHAQITAFDSCMWAEVALAQVLWALGYPDAALKVSEDAIASAERADHMASLSLAYNFHSMLLLNRGQVPEAMEFAGKVFVMGEKYGLEGHMGYAAMLSGIGSDNAEQLAGVIAFVEQLGFEMGLSYYRMGLAKVHAAKGDYASAIETVETALAKAHDCGELYNVAELKALAGYYRFKQDPSLSADAEKRLSEALQQSHEQNTDSIALRIGIMLTDLFRATGRDADVPALLEPLVASMQEGLELADMKLAKQLLEGTLSA